MESPETEREGAEKYRHLPPRPRPEDLRTSQDVVPHGEPDEAERERTWMLRTSGLFL